MGSATSSESNADGRHRPPLLSARGVSKVYADGGVTALDDVSLEISEGDYVSIQGPSGSGKSTLLNLLGGLETPTRGEVCYRGRPLGKLAGLDRYRSSEVGFVFQSFHLLAQLTARENVQIPMFETDRTARQRAARAEELLATVGMSHRAGHVPSRLSIGERQRVAIARAVANGPAVLLADEPTGNLDSRTGEEILALFDALRSAHGMTLVVITHDVEVGDRADVRVRMRDGRVDG